MVRKRRSNLTAIAYRSGVLAADTLVSCDDIVLGHASKIAKRADGAMAGATGVSIACEKFLDAFRTGRDGDFTIELKEEEDFEAVVISPDDKIWIVGDNGRHVLNAPFYALGVAREMLIGAMAAGALAAEAVGIAIRYHALCGGEVETYELTTEK